MNFLPQSHQKSVVKVFRLIAVSGSAIALGLSGNLSSALAAETPPRNGGQTFAQMCGNRASLSPEAKHTVEVLLKQAETTDCDAANQKLSRLKALYLIDNQISDLKPLQSLTNLTRLDLMDNQISDLKPLQKLTNLTVLDLKNNKISDLKPLQGLTKLKFINLSNNQISDLKPLQGMTYLQHLTISNNQISDLKPLQGRTNLTDIFLSNNQISDLKPLQGMTYLTRLDLQKKSNQRPQTLARNDLPD